MPPFFDHRYPVVEDLREAARRRIPGFVFDFLDGGCNDDVNKCIWSQLAWAPETDVRAILRDYSSYFIGANLADPLTEGLLALERNWRGALATNDGVEETLARFQSMERAATPAQLRNWRFQQLLYRL